MAAIIRRSWTRKDLDERGRVRRVKMVAYGYDLRVNGHRERRWSAEWLTEAQARAALTDREAAIAAGRVEPEHRTLGQVVEEYLGYKERGGKRSMRNDRLVLLRRVVPAFGGATPVRTLTGAAIARYERQRMGEVSAYTVANELGTIRHMLRLARRWGYLEHVPEIAMPRKPEARTRFLDEDEITRLLAACARSRNRYLSAIVTIAINTGMRKAEILGLEWERVDLAADYGFSAKVTLYRTKSGKPRGVPVNRAVHDALVRLEPNPARRQGLVFTKAGDRAWGQIRTAFATALGRAGIEGFRFHDLRHTAASHMVMRGASLADVKEVLGHADVKMTLRYAHLSPAHLRKAVDRLEGLTPTPAAAEAVEAASVGPRGHVVGHTMVESGVSAS